LAGAVDTLVMRDTAPPPRVMTGTGKDGDPAAPDALSPAPQNTSTPSGLLARIRGSASEAWAQFLQFAQSQTQDLIRIRVAQPTDELMVTPEAAVLVKANLRLQLLTARVALLTGQKATASADIAAVLASITRLTDPMAAPVQATVDGLQKAQAAIAALYVPTPQASLAALNALAVATPVR